MCADEDREMDKNDYEEEPASGRGTPYQTSKKAAEGFVGPQSGWTTVCRK